MKRAHISKATGPGFWVIFTYTRQGHFVTGTLTSRGTHTEALAHALAEVGLDKPIEHREAP